MGARSRKRGRTTRPTGSSAVPPTGATATVSRSAKTEAKNAAVRESLEPLAPGERPQWVTYAALFATFIGLLNIGLYAAGVKATGASFQGTVLVGLVLILCAGGMWRSMYGAVLAFEVLLGLTVAIAALSLLVSSSWTGAIRSLLVVLVCGTFFWKLIRAMARLQMPERPGARTPGR